MKKYYLMKPAQKIICLIVCLVLIVTTVTLGSLSIAFYANGWWRQTTMVGVLVLTVPVLLLALYVLHFVLYFFSVVRVYGKKIIFKCWNKKYNRNATLTDLESAHEMRLCPVARLDIGAQRFLVLCFDERGLDVTRFKRKRVTNNRCLGLYDVIRQKELIVAPVEAEPLIRYKKRSYGE